MISVETVIEGRALFSFMDVCRPSAHIPCDGLQGSLGQMAHTGLSEEIGQCRVFLFSVSSLQMIDGRKAFEMT